MNLDLRRQYLETGRVFVPQLLRPERVARLRMVCEHVLSQWRVRSPENGQPGIEYPDQFVTWHLNHPGYFSGRRDWCVDILEAVADEKVLGVVREILGEEPIFRSTSLWINPLVNSLDGHWHRDSQFLWPQPEAEDAKVLEEAERIRRDDPLAIVQLQIALVPSEDSEYVPGSHLRLDTPEENFIRLSDGQKHNRSNQMPGAVRTRQDPGDAVAFHAFGIHRGRYHADKYRRTLLFTYTTAAWTPEDQFSNQPWFLEPGYLDGLSPAARAFYQSFVERFQSYWQPTGPVESSRV